MASGVEQKVSDFFVDSLKKLTERDSPLQLTLGQLRESLQTRSWNLAPQLEGNLRQVDRDLSALQVGSRRIVKHLEQLQGLVHTSALITSSLEIDEVLEEVMDTAITLTHAERAYLVLRDEQSGELVLRAARNWDRESLDEYEVKFSRSVLDTVMETGEPVLTVNAQGDSRFQGNESILVNDLRSIICIPLKLREQVMGVLYADNRFEQGVFDDDSVSLTSTFANHAAIAIDNARHFERVKAELSKAEKEVSRLKIEINQQRLHSELSEVTETDYFQRLSSMARDIRQRKDGE